MWKFDLSHFYPVYDTIFLGKNCKKKHLFLSSAVVQTFWVKLVFKKY